MAELWNSVIFNFCKVDFLCWNGEPNWLGWIVLIPFCLMVVSIPIRLLIWSNTPEIDPKNYLNPGICPRTTRLEWLVEKNPKPKDTAAYFRARLYWGKPTVDEFLVAGGDRVDLSADIAKGYVALRAP